MTKKPTPDPAILKSLQGHGLLNDINNASFEALTGAMGVYVQPRTKGRGHGSTSRAFYARTVFIKRVLGL